MPNSADTKQIINAAKELQKEYQAKNLSKFDAALIRLQDNWGEMLDKAPEFEMRALRSALASAGIKEIMAVFENQNHSLPSSSLLGVMRQEEKNAQQKPIPSTSKPLQKMVMTGNELIKELTGLTEPGKTIDEKLNTLQKTKDFVEKMNRTLSYLVEKNEGIPSKNWFDINNMLKQLTNQSHGTLIYLKNAAIPERNRRDEITALCGGAVRALSNIKKLHEEYTPPQQYAPNSASTSTQAPPQPTPQYGFISRAQQAATTTSTPTAPTQSAPKEQYVSATSARKAAAHPQYGQFPTGLRGLKSTDAQRQPSTEPGSTPLASQQKTPNMSEQYQENKAKIQHDLDNPDANSSTSSTPTQKK